MTRIAPATGRHARPSHAPAPRLPTRTPTASSTTRGRVRHAEDSTSVRAMLQMLVRSWGYDVDVAPDGRIGAELARAATYDVIVTDIDMPHVDGVGLMKAVRSHDADVPIVILTGAPTLTSAIHGIEYGAFQYLTKPADPKALREVIDRASQLSRLARFRREAMAHLGQGELLSADRARLEAIYERAVDTLWIAYQPIIYADRPEIFGFEALLRVNDPDVRGPVEMLDVADRTDRRDALATTIRNKTVSELLGAEERHEHIFVNVHPLELADPGMRSIIEPLSPIADRVVLEITERAALDGIRDVASRARTLREHGFRLAIDDLGAGYSSLNSFTIFEPELVKIDMTLVRDIDGDDVKKKLVGGMTDVCHNLGITVVAEGVETDAERDALIELGCDLLQGYRFAKPARAFPDVRW